MTFDDWATKHPEFAATGYQAKLEEVGSLKIWRQDEREEKWWDDVLLPLLAHWDEVWKQLEEIGKIIGVDPHVDMETFGTTLRRLRSQGSFHYEL